MNLFWLSAVVVLVTVGGTIARPNTEASEKPDSSIQNGELVTEDPSLQMSTIISNEEKSSGKKVIEDFATVARSSSNDPSLNPAVAKVADQLVDTVHFMIDKDMRTPPKLKEILKEKAESKNETITTTVEPMVDKIEANGKFELKEPTLAVDTSEGKAAKKDEIIKGVAVPVIMDEEVEASPKLQKIPNVAKPSKEEKKKVQTSPKPHKETPTTTPSSGLSTWILLSDNKDSTTPASPKGKKPTTTTKKPGKLQTTTVRIITNKPTNKKPTPKPDIKKNESTSALEAMVKNQKKSVTTVRPILKVKVNSEKKEEEVKKVITVPPAIMIETTEVSVVEEPTTDGGVETTTKKKKTSSKKRKKNKNRRKKPAEKSGNGPEIKDLIKQPKQPVGAQFYNFLSREIMPTVGLGLVGVLVTAGLAGLLGYNPFNNNHYVRRTYESQHGYSPNHNYYTYNSEYGDTDGGQNEEVLFREVLSGMPEDNRYTMPHSEVSYPEAQLYNSQEQAYVSLKTSQPVQGESAPAVGIQTTTESKNPSASHYSAVYGKPYQPYSSKDSYSSYAGSQGGSYGYPVSSTTEKYKASAKYSGDTNIEKQPEALYRVSSDYSTGESLSTADDGAADSETSWHKIGSPVDYSQYSNLEPGPRRLNIDKMTEQLTGSGSGARKRSKRSPEGIIARLVRRSKEVIDLENEQDNEIDFDNKEDKLEHASTTESKAEELTTYNNSDDSPFASSTEETKMEDVSSIPEELPSLIDSFPSEVTSTQAPSSSPTFMDVVRLLAQYKLRIGIQFLKTTADAFSEYLGGVQKKMESAMSNDSSFPSLRNIFRNREETIDSEGHFPTSDIESETMRIREKRFQRDIPTNHQDDRS